MSRDFGAYTLHELRGGGGMGKLYRATQKNLAKTVAIKLLRSVDADDEGVVARFRREALLGAGLNHEHLVQVLDLGVYDGEHFIAMEYVEGDDLKEWLAKHGPVPIEIAVLLMRDISRGIEHAHQHGLVHRDIKPGNIMFRKDGVVKITDFGLARLTGTTSLRVTLPGTVIGAPAYMSPEQALGQEVDLRSDIFSAGVVGYELFGGERPFPGDTHSAVRDSILNHEQKSLGALSPLVPDEVADIVDKMLEKDREKRCRSMEIVRSVLEMTAEQMGLLRGDRELLREYARNPEEKALELRKRRLSLCMSLGTNFQRTGREKYKDALLEFERVLYLDPSNREAKGHIDELKKEMEQLGPVRKSHGLMKRIIAVGISLIAVSAVLLSYLWWMNRPATVTITTETPRALVYLDDTQLPAVSPIERKLKEGKHTVRAVKDGYRSFEQVLSLKAGERVPLTVRLDSIASSGPVAGRVRIRTSPPGARIMVDGSPRSALSDGSIKLPPGSHSIRVEKEGFKSVEQDVTVGAGSLLPIQLTLVPNIPGGTLQIRSDPKGAKVLLNGNAYSHRTNTVMRDVLPGTYQLDLELSGYESWKKNVSVTAGGDATVTAVLQAVPGGKGTLEIKATPYADFYVDGKVADTNKSTFTVDLDAAGTHTIRVVHPICGYKEWKDFRVKPGEHQTLKYDFLKDTGRISVSCLDGLWGYIELDGVRKALTTPNILECISAGRHTVSLVHDGFTVEGGARTVVVAAGQQSIVSFKLLPK